MVTHFGTLFRRVGSSTLLTGWLVALCLGAARSEEPPCPDPNRAIVIVERTTPKYPFEARKNRWEGSVQIAVFVTSADTIADSFIHESCGHAVLDSVALDTVRGWKYSAKIENCIPIGAWAVLTLAFHL
jgi:periplasmic protein TonB